MQKQIKKTNKQLKIVEKWFENCLKWKYKNNWLILEYLNKREEILYKRKRKLIKLNKNVFMTFWL